MNHREPPHLSAATRRAGLWLTLPLLSTMAPTGVHALPRSLTIAIVSRNVETTPYLTVTGAPPLRFREPAVPSEPAPRLPETTTSAPASTTQVELPLTSPPGSTSVMATTVDRVGSDPAPAADKPAGPESSPAPAKTPPPILPDDSRVPIRPEDFIPYFQIPGSARHPADVTLLVPAPKTPPAPAPLPASSATYTQTPK